jgi:hypothetical protein
MVEAKPRTTLFFLKFLPGCYRKPCYVTNSWKHTWGVVVILEGIKTFTKNDKIETEIKLSYKIVS